MLSEKHTVLGYPAREPDRERLRQLQKRAKNKELYTAPDIRPDSIELPCANCSMVCTISPGQQKKLRELAHKGIDVWCIFCLEPLVKDVQPDQIQLVGVASEWD